MAVRTISHTLLGSLSGLALGTWLAGKWQYLEGSRKDALAWQGSLWAQSHALLTLDGA